MSSAVAVPVGAAAAGPVLLEPWVLAVGQGLRIGAMARNADVAAHPLVRTAFPLVSAAMLAAIPADDLAPEDAPSHDAVEKGEPTTVQGRSAEAPGTAWTRPPAAVAAAPTPGRRTQHRVHCAPGPTPGEVHRPD